MTLTLVKPISAAGLLTVAAHINRIDPPAEWTPCTTANPKNSSYVIVTLFSGEVTVAGYCEASAIWEALGGDELDCVVAWQPMPKAWLGKVVSPQQLANEMMPASERGES